MSKENLVQPELPLPYTIGELAARNDWRAHSLTARSTYKIPYSIMKTIDGWNPRTTFDEVELNELADDIFANGQNDPIRGDLLKDGSAFLIRDGERRFRAIGILIERGIEFEYVEVMPYPVKTTEVDKLVSNLATEKKVKYNPVEMANGVLRLKTQFSLTNEEIGTKMGKSRQWVDNQIRIAKADQETKNSIESGDMGVTKAVRHLASKTKASDEMSGILPTSKNATKGNSFIPQELGLGGDKKEDAAPPVELEKELTEQEQWVADLKKALLKMEGLSSGLNDQAQSDFNYSFNWAMKQIELLVVFFSASKNKGVSVSIEAINELIRGVNSNHISDGYHTFGELYGHRVELYIALCKYQSGVWRSKVHHDGEQWEGWFLLGIGEQPGQQITYHLPIEKWDDCDFADTLEKAPEFDKHTSADVLERIKQL